MVPISDTNLRQVPLLEKFVTYMGHDTYNGMMVQQYSDDGGQGEDQMTWNDGDEYGIGNQAEDRQMQADIQNMIQRKMQ